MFGLFKKKDTAKEKNVTDQTDQTAKDVKAAEDKVRDTLRVQEEQTRPAADTSGQRVEMDEFVPPPGMTGGTPSGIPGYEYSPVDPNEEFKATGGEPLETGVPVASVAAFCPRPGPVPPASTPTSSMSSASSG